MAPAAAALDPSLYWGSFITLFDELDAVPLGSDLPDSLVSKIKSNHGWFLDSVARFKPPSEGSRAALDRDEILVGSHRFVVKSELKDAALRASTFLCLDQVQSYILVNRTFELNKLDADVAGHEILQLILLQYYLERQCLLKCVRCIFVHALYTNNRSSNDAIRLEALQLANDGLEGKLSSILHELFSSEPSEKIEVDYMVLWVEESLIEDNLLLDILFLLYYDDFCNCNVDQWKTLCSLFKGTLSGSIETGKLAVSVEAINSFSHAKAQLLLILIESLDLENLLRMVHDEVPLRQGFSKFSLSDVQEMDALVSGFSELGAVEAEPLILAWGIFICLLSSLPDDRQHMILSEIDHVSYVRQAFEGAPLNYLLNILRSGTFRDSYGLLSGFLCIMRTYISAFIASYDLTHQGGDNILDGILDIIYHIYHGEESLAFQFWDKDSFVDGPIRSLLYVFEKEYPFHTVKLVRLLSALSEGTWAAECVYKFLDNMRGITLPIEIAGSLSVAIETHHPLSIPGVEGLVIPSGTRGHCLKVIDENVMLVRWECAHSGIFLLLLQLAQEPHPENIDIVVLTLKLLYQLVSCNKALCFSLLNINNSSLVEAARNSGQIEKNVRVDVVKIVCSLIRYFVQDDINAGAVTICIKFLGQMLTCAPSHVIDVVLRSNIININIDSSSSDKWLLSGGLARMLLADYRGNADNFSLITSVLDFTVHLVKAGAENDMVSALVGFSLQFVLVNHLNWFCKSKHTGWKVTLKVLEVMKTCVIAFGCPCKRYIMLRDILLNNSSIYNVLCRIIYTPSEAMERSHATSYSAIKEVEDLHLTVCCALDIVYSLLGTLSQEMSSTAPAFVQTLLSSTKRVSVVSAVISMIYSFHNPALQVSALRLVSMLCYVTSRVLPNSVENIGLVVDSIQVKNLNGVIYTILQNGDDELSSTVVDFLISAARYQPALLLCLLLPEEKTEASLDSSGMKKNLAMAALSVSPLENEQSSLIDSILKYLRKSDGYIKSSPQVLLSFLILLKALWEGGQQYIRILEKIRSSNMIWEKMSTVVATKADIDILGKDIESDQVDCKGYRFECQATVLEIMAHELFLQEKLLQDMPENPSSNSHHLKVILSTLCESSRLDNLIISCSSGRYDNDVVLQAKIAVCLCVLHLAWKLSVGDAGCLSTTLVEKIHIISNKLTDHPAFLALLAQYASYHYRERKELKALVLNDLYYQLMGQLEGREIAPGPFAELLHFLLELDIFQCNECNYGMDTWPPKNEVHMFHISCLTAEFRMDLWDYSDWKASKEVAERMFLHMHNANLFMRLTNSQSHALRALTGMIYLYEGNVPKTRLLIGSQISESLLQSNINYLCKHLQTFYYSVAPALNQPLDLLELVSALVELLLVLSRILFSEHSHVTNSRKFFPLSVLLIKTSGLGIKLLFDIRPVTVVLKSAVKLLLLLLLTSFEHCFPITYSLDKSDLENKMFDEVSLTNMELLPILCKYVDNTDFFDLSVASLDLMLKGFLASKTWLPIVRKHLQLDLVIQKFQLRDPLVSVSGVLNFLLTLANVKGGAEMLHAANVFTSLKVLFTRLMDKNPISSKLDELLFSPAVSTNESYEYQWGLGLAIITSMVNSLADDFSSTDIVDSALSYFFSEKAYIISSYLAAPVFQANDESKKRARSPESQTSLSALRVTEQTLVFMCSLARHQNSWSKGTKEMDAKLRETVIHLLAFISRGNQRFDESPNKLPTAFCPPSLKAEVALNKKPSYVNSKHGWFTLSAIDNMIKAKVSRTSANGLSLVIKDRANENIDRVRQTWFSDTVAIQMYRVALLVLNFLCIHAKAAARRAEEVEFIDLARYPELPMPEILHGLQDQAIAIVTELCGANRPKPMPTKNEELSLLLLQILEKSLYIELCVSQSYGMRPVFGHIEDFSKEIKLLLQAVEQHSKLKAFLGSLVPVIDVLYPGLLETFDV